eukprot:gene30256-35243_t
MHGGPSTFPLVKQIRLLAASLDVELQLQWRPRTDPEQQLADKWSKLQDPSDWSLLPEVYNKIISNACLKQSPLQHKQYMPSPDGISPPSPVYDWSPPELGTQLVPETSSDRAHRYPSPLSDAHFEEEPDSEGPETPQQSAMTAPLVDRASGAALPEIVHNGKVYVVARPGVEFNVKISQQQSVAVETSQELLVAMHLDGVNMNYGVSLSERGPAVFDGFKEKENDRITLRPFCFAPFSALAPAEGAQEVENPEQIKCVVLVGAMPRR